MIELVRENETLILGCGDPLFGDAGFGPAVIRYIEKAGTLPPRTACLDVGTSCDGFLRDILLLEKKPARVIVIDAAGQPGRTPGEIFEIDVADRDAAKAGGALPRRPAASHPPGGGHASAGVRISVFAVQPACVPHEVAPGLSAPVAAAVPRMGLQVLELLGSDSC